MLLRPVRSGLQMRVLPLLGPVLPSQTCTPIGVAVVWWLVLLFTHPRVGKLVGAVDRRSRRWRRITMASSPHHLGWSRTRIRNLARPNGSRKTILRKVKSSKSFDRSSTKKSELIQAGRPSNKQRLSSPTIQKVVGRKCVCSRRALPTYFFYRLWSWSRCSFQTCYWLKKNL